VRGRGAVTVVIGNGDLVTVQVSSNFVRDGTARHGTDWTISGQVDK